MDSRSKTLVTCIRALLVGAIIAAAACDDSGGARPEQDAGAVFHAPPIDGPDPQVPRHPRVDAGSSPHDSGGSDDAGSQPVRACKPLAQHMTFREFLAGQDSVLELAGSRGGAYVDQGCGTILVQIPVFGISPTTPIVQGPFRQTGLFDGWGYAFDESGNLIARWFRSDITSESSCEGRFDLCDKVTRCLLDWDFARSGHVCQGEEDGGTEAEDAGGEDAGAA